MMDYAIVGGGLIGIRNPNVDPMQNGSYSIKGQVRELGDNIPCRVRLFEKSTGRLIADIETDNSGHYEFDYLAKTRFFIVAHHPASQFNAVIQDNVVPK
ncbi:carboxypeptidase regulatory-like domain-containing protein [Acinetobacter johnsonii]|uniref:carboxypeptidase regulatory-like domain-containing protein n=1 Tax=Acinetobacter johnsonii TaxID=40214 RepID=UPI003AF4507C